MKPSLLALTAAASLLVGGCRPADQAMPAQPASPLTVTVTPARVLTTDAPTPCRPPVAA